MSCTRWTLGTPGGAMRGVEVVAADHDDRHAVAPGVVDRHRRVLQADGAVAEHHHRLAFDLEVAVRHRDRRIPRGMQVMNSGILLPP